MSPRSATPPRRCQFCQKNAEWIVRGIDELTSEDVSLVTCNVHRGKTGRIGPVVCRYRQAINNVTK